MPAHANASCVFSAGWNNSGYLASRHGRYATASYTDGHTAKAGKGELLDLNYGWVGLGGEVIPY